MADREAYYREVVAQLTYLDTEDKSALDDISGTGFEADMRRAALDGIIAKMWDKNTLAFCNAMRLAGITALQAAKTFRAMQVLTERENNV